MLLQIDKNGKKTRKLRKTSNSSLPYVCKSIIIHVVYFIFFMGRMYVMSKVQKPMVFYAYLLLYMLIALCFRIVTFAPLLSLFIWREHSVLSWTWLLTIPLYFLILLPLRFSFAEGLVYHKNERYFSIAKALSLKNYWQKLRASSMYALSVLKWGVFFFIAVIMLVRWFQQDTLYSILSTLTAVGIQVGEIYNSIVGFFRGLFGSVYVTPLNAGIMQGIYLVMAGLGVCVLVWLVGIFRNSATRYLWALHSEKTPRKNRRLQAMYGIVNLLLWVPLICALSFQRNLLPSQLTNTMLNSLLTKSTISISWTDLFVPLFWCFLFFYFPLVPIRRLLTFSFANRLNLEKD